MIRPRVWPLVIDQPYLHQQQKQLNIHIDTLLCEGEQRRQSMTFYEVYVSVWEILGSLYLCFNYNQDGEGLRGSEL